VNIIVLAGGTSAERNVSLATSRAIANSLRESGHSVKIVDPIFGSKQPPEEKIFEGHTIGEEFPTAEELNRYSNRKVIECINSEVFDNTDIVFLGLHGKFGEDGRIQSLLEMRGVKYTGSGVTSSAMAMDKNISKIMFNHAGIPTAKWIMLKKSNAADVLKVDESIKLVTGYPVVIKPNDEGSTVGLSIVQPDVEDVQLGKALDEAFSYSGCVMAEEFIQGRELTVAVLGDEALPVVEIKPKDGFYDYEHKYTKGMTEYFCPAELPEELAGHIREKALLAHKTLGCKVYSRVDFRLNPKGEYYCLEVNTLPGMTELSLVPKSAKAVGLTFAELLNRIIELSLK
jgi:D-alanine-D-alanine ligase